ncbi:Inactive LRR receptor-like serine/threonine-protein kinase BIR2 [Zea mays]|uniref:Inactive LRR receptor-like serine/threonine-protein kinase BIR2 n=1 Tax=Zea mays TaxID=4577 RepID=A0A3L6GC58_MAIZE|nr:Inactive LRR receptor-like serine/threonine-protein kinase BIR2 [Zea mays]
MAVRCSCTALFPLLFCFMICQLCYGTITDIQCLKKLKASVDPDNKLEWTFNNNTEGSICFQCFGLKGEFPDGLENCGSMTLLDLSSNSLSGPIPADISRRVPFVTNLDLSFNSFLGEIPEALANCSYLNIVNLQHNKLTGTIPVQLAALSRLAQFNVADNQLSGQIPSSLSKFTASDFTNQDLCGRPLSNDCTANSSSRTGIIVGSAVGGAVITLIIAAVILFIVLQPSHSS